MRMRLKGPSAAVCSIGDVGRGGAASSWSCSSFFYGYRDEDWGVREGLYMSSKLEQQKDIVRRVLEVI